MRTIDVSLVTEQVRQAVQKINFHTPEPMMIRLTDILSNEPSPAGRAAMKDIVANRQIASTQQVPMCQDTGMAIIFMEVGQDVHFSGGDIREALQFLYDMIYKHKIFPDTALNQDYTAQNELYMADKIAFMREWPFFADVGKGKKDWYKPEKMVIELPPAGKAGSKSWIGGWGYSIPTAAPNPEGAKALLTYLTSVEVAPKLAAQQGFLLTPRNSILKALEGSDNALLPAIAAYSKANVFAARPFNPRVAEAQTVVDDVASSFLTKQSSLSDALKQGKERMKALSAK